MISIELNKLCAILLGKSIKDIYPHIINANYRVNENGFVYLFNLSEPISLNDLPKILKCMYKNIDRNPKINYINIVQSEALSLFKDNTYKQQIINKHTSSIDLIKFNNEYIDICENLRIEKISKIKHINLLNVSGEY
jgi:threonyl-tRNA synthetase